MLHQLRSLRLRPVVRTAQGFAIANATSKRYLRAFTAENHTKINYCADRIPAIENILASIKPEDLQHSLQVEIKQETLRKALFVTLRNALFVREKLKNKFNNLIRPNQSETNKNLI